MVKAIATLLLVAQLGALAAPTLAYASPLRDAAMTHCVPTVSHSDASVTQMARECDGCAMPDCLGTASCFHAGVAIVSLSSITFIPAAETATALESSSDGLDLLRTPFPPPPKP